MLETKEPTAEKSLETIDPQTLLQLFMSFMPGRILATAVQLDIFSIINAGNSTAETISKAANASPRGVAMLLDALVSLQLIGKRNSQYELSPLAKQFLVKESPDYLGAMMEDDSHWISWSQLTESVKTGKPHTPVNTEEATQLFFKRLVRSLHIVNRQPAKLLSEALRRYFSNSSEDIRVIDIACGSGIWGISFAESYPNARVTAQDLPKVLDLAREYVTKHNVETQYDFLPGDLRKVDLGKERYDIALLGNILHSEGEESSKDLLKRLYSALKPGGAVVIIDMIPNDERTGPPFALFFALNMLVHTKEGSTYTSEEYRNWLNLAGFYSIENIEINSHSPAIVAYK